MRYCAPECLPAASGAVVAVSSAADMWSVGVVAFELLTSTRVFPADATDVSIQQLLHSGGLPWEGQTPGGQELCARLCGLRGPVMACLRRDAAARPSAAALLSSVEQTLDRTRSRGTFAQTSGYMTADSVTSWHT